MVKGTRVVVGDKGGEVYGESVIVNGYVKLGEEFAGLLIELGEDDFELYLEYEEWDMHFRVKTHDGMTIQSSNIQLEKVGRAEGYLEEFIIANAKGVVESLKVRRKWKLEESE